MSTHSPTGASSMHRWEPCPGSVALSKTVPPPPSSEAAKEGTLAHEKAELWLSSGVKPAFDDPEMEEAVGRYVGTCNSYFTEAHQKLGAQRRIEFRFDHSALIPGMYGTADYVALWPWAKTLVVIDLKYGVGKYVEEKNNPQLLYYALGAYLSVGKTIPGQQTDIECIELGIMQPRYGENTEVEPYRSYTIPVSELWAFRIRLEKAIAAATSPNAPLQLGAHCQWCPAIVVCPEQIRQKEEALKGDFTVIPLKGTAYDTRKLAKALDARDALSAYLKALDEFAYRELEQGVIIPGYKLVAKRGQRKYTDEAALLKHLKAAGIPDTSLYPERALLSPAQLEKKIPTYKTVIDLHTKTESSGRTIAPESDPRPAITKSPEQDFAPVLTLESLGL